MSKRAVLPVLFLSGLFFFGQAAPPKAGQVLTPAAKAAELVSFLRDDSFRAAANLADRLLADPALDVETMAVCGLAVLLGGRIDEAETILTKSDIIKMVTNIILPTPKTIRRESIANLLSIFRSPSSLPGESTREISADYPVSRTSYLK